MGVLSVKSGQLEKAVVRFAKVVEINPSRKDAEFLLARCYADMGQRDKAIPILGRLKNDSSINGLAVQAATLYDKLNSNQ
ncbi:MAG: tetratricopeptide repeat protein [Bacteroidota bacterium]